MKKDKRIMAVALAMTATMTGCGTGNEPEVIYGPPSYFESELSSVDVVEEIYGPPSAFEEETSVFPSEVADEDTVHEEEIELIYGPPSAFEEDLTEE